MAAPFPTLAGAMAPPRRALLPRARPRRGSVERPVNARLVRGTWLLVALPLLLTAFSVARPQPCRRRRCRRPSTSRSRSSWHASSHATIPTGRPAPWKPRRSGVGRRAVRALRLRPPGRPLHGADPGRGEVELQNLVTVVRGGSQRTIVITAHRDNSGEGLSANDNASGTGALIELPLVRVGRRHHSRPGAACAHARLRLHRRRRLRRARRGPVRGELALPRERARGDQPRRDRWPRPAAAADRRRYGALTLGVARADGGDPRARAIRPGACAFVGSAPAARPRLSVTLGEQGPFVARGIPALTLTTLPGQRRPTRRRSTKRRSKCCGWRSSGGRRRT